MTCTLNVNHLTVQIGSERLIDDMSFTLPSGQFMGVIGPNGSGKSTLFKMILGVAQPLSGTITVSDEGKTVTPSSVIGYVPQSRSMDADHPIAVSDFISMGLPHRIRPWLSRAEKQIVQEMMELTKTAPLSARSIGHLSGGEKQRVYLAQSLVRKPKILLLDEPTASLDPGAQKYIAQLVHRVSRELGISVLFISHDMNLIQGYADRILYMTRSSYAVGSLQEVLNSDVLSALYDAPMHVHASDCGLGFEIHPGSIHTERERSKTGE